jgi:hypothetical protein
MLSPDFTTTLLRPALSASFMSCSQSLAMNMMILVRGAVAAISRVDSAPAPCQARRCHFLPHRKPSSSCWFQCNTERLHG